MNRKEYDLVFQAFKSYRVYMTPEQEFLDDCKDYWDDAYDESIQEIKEID